LTPSRRGRDSLAEGSTVDAGAVSKIAADRGAGFEPSVPVAKEPPSVWKGQLGNSRTVERGQSQKSVVPLGGDRGFESCSLQRRVRCEPDFLSLAPPRRLHLQLQPRSRTGKRDSPRHRL